MNYIQLLRREPAVLSYGALHFFFSGPGQTFFISLFVPYFLLATGATNDSFNLIYMVATLGSAFTLPWIGGFVDQWKIRNVSLSIGGGLLLFSLLASQVYVWWMLIPAIFGLRLFGQGMMPLVGSTAIARYFTVARGKALSLINFGISLSEMTLPLLMVAIISWAGWRWGWVAMAAMIGLVFIPLIIRLIPLDSPFQIPKKEEPVPGQKIVKSATRKEVMKDPGFYLLTMVYLFLPMFMTGFMLNQSQIGGLLGATAAQMALGISLFGGARMFFNVLAGPLIDRFTATKSFAFILVPVLTGLVLLTAFPGVWTIWVFFIMGGMSSSLTSLTTTAMWAELYGTDHLGAIKSLVSTFVVFSTAVGPVLVGLGLGNMQEFMLLMLITVGVVLLLNVIAFVMVSRMLKRGE